MCFVAVEVLKENMQVWGANLEECAITFVYTRVMTILLIVQGTEHHNYFHYYLLGNHHTQQHGIAFKNRVNINGT